MQMSGDLESKEFESSERRNLPFDHPVSTIHRRSRISLVFEELLKIGPNRTTETPALFPNHAAWIYIFSRLCRNPSG
jgi:hypothetical protein